MAGVRWSNVSYLTPGMKNLVTSLIEDGPTGPVLLTVLLEMPRTLQVFRSQQGRQSL